MHPIQTFRLISDISVNGIPRRISAKAARFVPISDFKGAIHPCRPHAIRAGACFLGLTIGALVPGDAAPAVVPREVGRARAGATVTYLTVVARCGAASARCRVAFAPRRV